MINLHSISTDLLHELLIARNSTVCVYTRDSRAHFRRDLELCCCAFSGILRMKTSGWVAAGASEQQEQHELEEESGFVDTRIKGGERGRRREGRRAAEKRIDEEIPSRRVSSRCVILFNDNGCEVDACQLGNALSESDFYASLFPFSHFLTLSLSVPFFPSSRGPQSGRGQMARATLHRRRRREASGSSIPHRVKKDGRQSTSSRDVLYTRFNTRTFLHRFVALRGGRCKLEIHSANKIM